MWYWHSDIETVDERVKKPIGLKTDLNCIFDFKLFFSHHTRKWLATFGFPLLVPRPKRLLVTIM